MIALLLTEFVWACMCAGPDLNPKPFPADGAEGVAIDQRVGVLFEEELADAPEPVLTGPEGEVPGTVERLDTGHQTALLFLPDEFLAINTEYRLGAVGELPYASFRTGVAATDTTPLAIDTADYFASNAPQRGCTSMSTSCDPSNVVHVAWQPTHLHELYEVQVDADEDFDAPDIVFTVDSEAFVGHAMCGHPVFELREHGERVVRLRPLSHDAGWATLEAEFHPRTSGCQTGVGSLAWMFPALALGAMRRKRETKGL